jgi:hypothetical protein
MYLIKSCVSLCSIIVNWWSIASMGNHSYIFYGTRKIKRCFLVCYEIINYYLNIWLNLRIFQIYFHNAILNTLFTSFFWARHLKKIGSNFCRSTTLSLLRFMIFRYRMTLYYPFNSWCISFLCNLKVYKVCLWMHVGINSYNWSLSFITCWMCLALWLQKFIVAIKHVVHGAHCKSNL